MRKIPTDGKLPQDREQTPLVMTAAEQTVAPGTAAPKQIGEWFWRFLALIMLATIGWIVWVVYQINPRPLVTDAAFEAAAKARASQDARGVITRAAVPVVAVPGPAETPPPEPKEPPVNLERLKLSDSIETPIPEHGNKK